MLSNEHQMSYLDDTDRLRAYQSITSGCQHLWSKNTLQTEKAIALLNDFAKLAEDDPYFLAHLTSYVITKLDSKDLKVVSTFINSLNDADGTPFTAGGSVKKPNLRTISQAAIQKLDPKLVHRVIELANLKVALGKKRIEGTHFSRSLKTAIKKYIRYREQNPKAIEGIKKVGLGKTFQNLYRSIHAFPTIGAAQILGWNQKIGGKVEKRKYFDFSDMSDVQIAEKIRTEKLPPTGVLGALPDKISPVIAVAILEQATGDQAVILRELFDSQGLLKEKEVMQVFTEKIKTAKTALDRVDKIKTDVDAEVTKELKKARAEKRKEQVGDLGKVFLHIDISGSMDSAITVAKNSSSIIAECVQNPETNFHWGAFNNQGYILNRPPNYEKDGFLSILYGLRAGGGTNCMACYKYAREQGCRVDVFITDQGHNSGSIESVIQNCEREGLGKPEAVVIVQIRSSDSCSHIQRAFEHEGIPVAILQPTTLTESAMVSQAVKEAMKGAIVVIDEIMATPLLRLPEWWSAVE